MSQGFTQSGRAPEQGTHGRSRRIKVQSIVAIGSTLMSEVWSGREALARRNLPYRPARAQASAPLRTRSNSRRRRLLGRPSPRTSMITGPVLATTGGLWSTKQVVATAAPTRDSIGRMTSTMRLRAAMSASTRSPARTFVDGFAGDPFTRTWPPSHNRVASGRVFTRRTAHSQRSIRVSSVARGSVTRCWMARPRRGRGERTRPDRTQPHDA